MVLCPLCASPCDESHQFCVNCGGPVGVAAVRADPLIGRTLPGGYRVQHLVGVGGMGRVYLADQTALGRTVAVKVIHPHLVGDEQTAARFITEARAASRLNHPNSIAIFDFGKTDDDQLYLVMEYLRGRDLGRVVEDEGPLAHARIVDILSQALGALEEAHELAIIHRDLKPENIVLEPMRSGRDFVKVVDYGLAKTPRREGGQAITTPGFVCGTPDYMSPEQGRGDTLDARSDLYAIGVMLFQLLTGRLPFVADGAAALLLAHMNDPPPDPRSIEPRVPEPLALVTLRALRKKREDRFTSARAFAEALKQALSASKNVWDPAPPTTSIRCRSCGALNVIMQKFCGECGAPMSANSEERPTARPPRKTPKAPPNEAKPKRTSERPTIPKLQAVRPSSPPASVYPRPRTTETQVPSVRPHAPSSPGPTSSAGAASEIALLERDEDLAWLEARLEDARAMPCGARIVGADGTGKTRLLHTFLARCPSLDAVVVAIEPDPAWSEVTGFALCHAIRQLAQLPADGGSESDWVDADDGARAGLSDLFREPHDDVAPSERREAFAEALRWALARRAESARGGVVVLAVDDLEEIDGVSRHAIVDVISEPPLVRALLVVTHAAHTNAAPSLIGPGEGRVLTELSREAVTALLGPSRTAREAMTPFHVEQVLSWRRRHDDPSPESLDELIGQRIDRLSLDERRVLHAIAVGLDDEEAIRRALPLQTDVTAALELLENAGLIRGLRVAHFILRDAVLTALPSRARAEVHAAAFEIATERDAPPEVRAKHAYRAASGFPALVLLDQVSRLRAARGDGEGSVLALRRGLEVARVELSRGEIDDPVRAVLLFSRKLAEALATISAYADAEGVLREALDMADPNDTERAHLLASLARMAHLRQHEREARSYVEEALRLARRSDARELVASLETLERDIAVA